LLRKITLNFFKTLNFYLKNVKDKKGGRKSFFLSNIVNLLTFVQSGSVETLVPLFHYFAPFSHARTFDTCDANNQNSHAHSLTSLNTHKHTHTHTHTQPDSHFTSIYLSFSLSFSLFISYFILLTRINSVTFSLFPITLSICPSVCLSHARTLSQGAYIMVTLRLKVIANVSTRAYNTSAAKEMNCLNISKKKFLNVLFFTLIFA